MNFFEAQDRSRRNTRRLVAVMTLAVVIVAASVTAVIAASLWLATTPSGSGSFLNWALASRDLFVWIALGTIAFIGFTSLYRITSLRQGGGKVARDLGGTLVHPGDGDPLRRRLRNVVEEMALASGIPTPEVYVLDHEPGINAFAAGFSTDDAAVAVTRGTLETLDRDELQGVIAHEFSHVFNGDMRLNIQLMGPMFGLLAIGLLGRILLRGSRSTGRSRGKASGAGAILALGAGLAVTGYVGLLLARLIKAGVSRQREYLADASAVQFTRQTAGIAGALKKIAGYREHSTIHDIDAEEVSHMLFASGFNSISSLLATHPPLLNRIQALEPSFNETQFAQLDTASSQLAPDAELEKQFVGLAGNAQPATSGVTTDPAYASQHGQIDAAALASTIGNPDEEHYLAAQVFAANLPADIRDALESAYQVMLLIPALLLHTDTAARAQQLALLGQQLGAERCRHVQRLYAALQTTKIEARLPILNLALPLVKEQPAGRLEYLSDLLEQVATQDNEIELFEYALLRIYQHYIQRAANPAARRKWQTLQNKAMQAAATELLHLFAVQTGIDANVATTIVQRELGQQGIPTTFGDTISINNSGAWVGRTDAALDRLQNCTPPGRQILIQALISLALHDGHISQTESELLRAICAILGCPLPPIIAAV
jgi:Zn-dependent protease with chaperone function